MSELKIGERVRIIANHAGSCNRVGDIGIITEFKYDYAKIKVKNKSSTGNYSFIEDITKVPSFLNQQIKTL